MNEMQPHETVPKIQNQSLAQEKWTFPSGPALVIQREIMVALEVPEHEMIHWIEKYSPRIRTEIFEGPDGPRLLEDYSKDSEKCIADILEKVRKSILD